MGDSKAFPCPRCGADLSVAIVDINGVIRATEDPEAKARLEIAITCDECEEDCFAFISSADLVDADGNGFQEVRS
jgi:transcription elongation factor Elf1